MKYTIALAALALLGEVSAINKNVIFHDGMIITDPSTDSVGDSPSFAQRNSTGKSIPEFVDKYHTETMNDANAKDAERVKAINAQEQADSWRGKKNTV